MKLYSIILFLISFIGSVFAQADLFEVKLAEYVNTAKELSKKQLSFEDESKLSEMVVSILSLLRDNFIQNKLKIEKIIFKYPTGEEFPDLAKHKFENNFDEQIIKFTIGFYQIFKNLNKEHISEIVKKSPLEFVPIFQEMRAFLEFITSDPKDFGHGVFSEKDENSMIIFPTNDALLRIMKPIVYRYLLKGDYKIFKLSRITSAFYRDFATKTSDEIFKDTIESLKRNTSDDSRITIFMHGDKK